MNYGNGPFGALFFLIALEVSVSDVAVALTKKSESLISGLLYVAHLFKHPPSFDLDLPLEVDDDYWETGDPETDFRQPPGRPSKISAFNLLLRLMQILAFSLKTIVSFVSSSS